MDLLTADTHMAIIFYLTFALLSLQSWALEMQQPFLPEGESFRLLSVDYLSWQQEGSVKSAGVQSPIVITNQGLCAGGTLGRNYKSYLSFIDGCFIYGSGNAGSEKNTITYNQSHISVYGAKVSLGIGKYVSKAKTEIGFKVPAMFVAQTFSRANSSTLREPEAFMTMASLYSRWRFEDWFVQTEFSKIIGNDLVLFSIGGGHQF
jgi:hypothetical protein